MICCASVTVHFTVNNSTGSSAYYTLKLSSFYSLWDQTKFICFCLCPLQHFIKKTSIPTIIKEGNSFTNAAPCFRHFTESRNHLFARRSVCKWCALDALSSYANMVCLTKGNVYTTWACAIACLSMVCIKGKRGKGWSFNVPYHCSN